VINFIIKNIFLRVSSKTDIYEFKTNFDNRLPRVHINEFVIWEIIEPLIQNSIDHSAIDKVVVDILTKYDEVEGVSQIIIRDNGKGIDPSLLETDKKGTKKIFLENESTKVTVNQNSGYGCYIAYQMAVKRCGGAIDAFNHPEGGAVFVIKIKNGKVN
jgi:signal transduction histidine kinase